MFHFIPGEAARTPLQRHEMQSGSPRLPGMATQLFCRRLIETAFHDAIQTDSRGRPTERALESWQWLSARTDWTLGGKEPPPPDVREEFFGTFEWACRWLGENPDMVRARGLPPHGALVFVNHQRRRDWVHGLPDIKRRWENSGVAVLKILSTTG